MLFLPLTEATEAHFFPYRNQIQLIDSRFMGICAKNVNLWAELEFCEKKMQLDVDIEPTLRFPGVIT